MDALADSLSLLALYQPSTTLGRSDGDRAIAVRVRKFLTRPRDERGIADRWRLVDKAAYEINRSVGMNEEEAKSESYATYSLLRDGRYYNRIAVGFGPKPQWAMDLYKPGVHAVIKPNGDVEWVRDV